MAMDPHVESLQVPVSMKEDGTLVCGPCPCGAGMGVVCSHITTMLCALHYAEKKQDSGQGPITWGLYPMKDGSAHHKESGTDSSKPAQKQCDKNNKSHTAQEEKTESVSTDAIETFYRALDSAAPTASEKSVLLSVLPQYCEQFKPKTTTASDEVLESSLPQTACL